MAAECFSRAAAQATTWSVCLAAGLALVLAVGACGSGERPADRSARVRVAYTSLVDVGDLPSLIAHRALASQGYDVQATFFAQPELAVEALARGDMEFANGGTRAFWAAVAKGADVVMVMGHVENGYQIAARTDVERCRDLTGRTLALSSPGALPTALGEAYLQRCPGARPIVLAMAHSGDRLAALVAGAVDAAVLQRADVTRLEQRAPGRFHVLVQLEQTFPDLRFEGLFVNGRFARDRRPVVVDYVRARVEANRRVLDDPALLVREAANWPAMGVLDESIVAGEIQGGAWARDGGLRPGSVDATLRFFIAVGSLPASLSADRLVDPSFLAEALRSMPPPAETGAKAPRQVP